MKTRVLTVLFISVWLLFLYPALLLAHSGLVAADPKELTESEVPQITLTFNMDIDQGSKVTVRNASGEEQAVKETISDGKVLKAIFEHALTNGVYTVDWRVISADGHPAKGSYSFEVRIPEPVTTPRPSETDPASSQPVPSASASAPPEATTTPPPAANAATSKTGGGLDFSEWALIAAAILLVVAVAVSMVKKRKSN